jgi:hypothetical protein
MEVIYAELRMFSSDLEIKIFRKKTFSFHVMCVVGTYICVGRFFYILKQPRVTQVHTYMSMCRNNDISVKQHLRVMYIHMCKC